MATIGQQLTAPEVGWKRYDQTNSTFKYTGTWAVSTNASDYGGSDTYSSTAGSKVSIRFQGTKIRIIAYANTDRANPTITIDGVSETINTASYSGFKVLVYEKIGLTNTIHTVEITIPTGGKIFNIDAIDIDDTGRLLHPDEVTDVKDLEVGKRIRCHYQASSGQVGVFSGLGQETGDFIPPTSSATPNGDFYFIMVEDWNGKKKLVADRNIQHSISWDTLNTAGVASGSGLPVDNQLKNKVEVYVGGTVTAIDGSASAPSKAFDGAMSTYSDGWYFNVSAPVGAWIQYAFTQPTIVNKLLLWSYETSGYESVGNFSIKASATGAFAGEEVTLFSGTHTSSNRFVEYLFDNSTPYQYIRLIVNSVSTGNGGNNLIIQEMGWHNVSIIPEMQHSSFTVRLMTGGTSASDKDNEWDKYIVSSTLNGTITAGENTVWNWNNIYSWTSTTYLTSSNRRAIRGYSSASMSTDGNVTTSYTAVNAGFRPVLIVEILTNPPTFEGSVDRTTVHSESVTLTGTVSHPQNKDAKYRILVNGVQEYPESDFTVLAPPPVSINYTISNSKFRLGSNQVTVEMVDSEGTAGTWSTLVNLESQAPIITADMTGMRLDATVGDAESDSVQFRVLLNGVQIHPVTGTYTDLMPTPVNYLRVFNSLEVNVGTNNVVDIIALDSFGAQSQVTINFVGSYSGLMFADETGNFYSTDFGEILQYLDIGILVAGQISLTYPVKLVNKTGFPVTNVVLWRDNKTLPSGAVVEISRTESPFVAEDNLSYPTLVQEEEITFYVRIVTQVGGNAGQGEFDVLVQADPS